MFAEKEDYRKGNLGVMHKKDKKRKKFSGNTPSGNSVKTERPKDVPKLEIVLKCESTGSLEAVKAAILAAAPTTIEINVFHAGIGSVNKSDIFMAESGSRLIIGYNVSVAQKLEPLLNQHGVEVRLYDVIYLLIDDIKEIAASLTESENTEEEILGKAKVIALFKSSRKGIILGCEVQKGRLAHGNYFRVITAMGPVYSGKIESLHIEKNTVQIAKRGQQVGLKISDFKKVSIEDLVECYRPASQKKQIWSPQGSLIRRLKGK